MAAFATVLAPLFWWYLLTSSGTESTVLDPSLYLLPSPPLATHDRVLWSQPPEPTRLTRDAVDNDVEKKTTTTTTEDPDSMESAETFWPSLRSYGLGGVHIPMTFSVSGTYGSGGYGSGVVGSNYGIGSGVASLYGSLTADEPSKAYGSYGKSALAGSSYGTYGGYPGVRLFGNSGKTGWSGWGNGKWGHYGKG